MSTRFELIYGTIWPKGHFFRQLQESFANSIFLYSSGDIVITVCRSGTEAEMLDATFSGQKMQMISTSAIQKDFPAAALFYLPFTYQDFNHFKDIWTLGTNGVGDYIARRIEQPGNLKVLGYTLVGPRDTILTNRPIVTLADFADIKIRVDGAEISVATFKSLGAVPEQIDYYDVANALATKQVEAAENSPFNFIPMGWHKDCRYLSLTSHRMLLNVEMVNRVAWETLPSDLQNIIADGMRKLTEEFAATAVTERDRAIAKLRNLGLQTNELDQSTIDEMTDTVQPLKVAFIKKWGLENEMQTILDSVS